MNLNTTTLIGNVVDDPTYKLVKDGGVGMCKFRIASNERWFSPESGWQDGDTLFIDVVCFKALALNAIESFRKGDRVIVVGRVTSRSYEKDEQRRVTYEVKATSLGVDLARQTAEIKRVKRFVSVDGAAEADAPFVDTVTGEIHESYDGPAVGFGSSSSDEAIAEPALSAMA